MSLVPGTGADANDTPSESTQLLREHVDNYATLRVELTRSNPFEEGGVRLRRADPFKLIQNNSNPVESIQMHLNPFKSIRGGRRAIVQGG
jgi:hypothetical protein